MANINLMLEDNLKKDFKIKTAQNKKQMSPVIRDFIEKFIKHPKETLKFIYK